MTAERQALYDRGLALCEQYHPLNHAGRRVMTKADILVIVGEQATRADAAEARVAALTEVVRWYADESNYNRDGAPGEHIEEGQFWEVDEGYNAREALAALDGQQGGA